MPIDETTPEGIRQTWIDRIRQARDAKKPHEPTMLVNLAFAAGQTHLVWDPRQKRMRHISEVDPRYADRELYSVNKIREYREAQLGELATEDERPQLLTAQDGDTAEQATRELNQAAGYAWEHEWEADQAIRKMRRFVVDIGVAAIRVYRDADYGQQVGRVPLDQQGNPVRDQALLDQLRQNGTIQGRLPQFKPVHEGRTCWKAYSGLQILSPPGVPHEDEFPWEVLQEAVLVDDLKALYGEKAAGLQEDTDIASVMGLMTGQEGVTGQSATNRARGCCWRFLCFQRPSKRWPKGRQAVLASSQFVLLDQKDEFDYELPGGRPHSGVVYFHWWRGSDRFWSQSFVGALKDPQRIIDRRETQNLEIIDRGMPKAYVEKGSLPGTPLGTPMEHIELDKQTVAPTIFAGIGPGPWMYQDLDHHADNLSHASTLSPLRLGENPQNVDTYSQLAQLNENEAVKRSEIKIEHRAATGTLLELSTLDIQRFWPDGKQLLVSGEGDQIGHAVYRKANMPAFFMAKVAKGAPQPRSQAAELKKIDAVFSAAVQSGVTALDPQAWTDWYSRSIDAGAMQELPQPPKDSQQEIARLENELMRDGEAAPVFDYDLLPVHLPEHREAMDQARAAGDVAWLQALTVHVQEHIARGQENAARVAEAAAGQQTAPPPAGLAAGPPAPQVPPAGDGMAQAPQPEPVIG